jgi:CRP/FNR family cyclic AMP-dependent transcriptional regulator
MSERLKKYTNNEYVLREGQDSSEMYYLHSGNLAIFKKKGDHEIQIGTIRAGELVGEMSFLDEAPRSASVKAMDDCLLVEIPRENFKSFIEGQPIWFKALLNTMLERFRKTNNKIKV